MNEEIKIEKGIPIPPSHAGRAAEGNSPLHALKKLEVGDSFISPKRAKCFGAYAKTLGIKLTTRKTPDGIRVWRIA